MQYTYIVIDAFVVFILCLNVDGELWQERALKKRKQVRCVKDELNHGTQNAKQTQFINISMQENDMQLLILFSRVTNFPHLSREVESRL